MSMATRVSASRAHLVYLARLKESLTGRDAWYYVQLKSKALEPVFLKKIETGINLEEYGEVLYSGWGSEPPEAIVAQVRERFTSTAN